jgi:hypothetical protein
MSWISNFFGGPNSNAPIPPTPIPNTAQSPSSSSADSSSPSSSPLTSSQSPSAEEKLAKDLQDQAERNRQYDITVMKKVEEHLIEWGESDPIDVSFISGPFQDPLSHLTFQEQKAYLANPPTEYLTTLENRATARELCEKQIYLADPLNNWRLCYDERPYFGAEIFPPWKNWDSDKRLTVMEKYRRYDERLQRNIQHVFETFDSNTWHNKKRKEMIIELDKYLTQKRTWLNYTTKMQRKKRKPTSPYYVPHSVVNAPPACVIDVKVWRKAIAERNGRLKMVLAEHVKEVSVFEDISEEGVLASAVREQALRKALREEEVSEMKSYELLEEWEEMTDKARVEKVNWGAIHSEV